MQCTVENCYGIIYATAKIIKYYYYNAFRIFFRIKVINKYNTGNFNIADFTIGLKKGSV